MLFVVYTTHAPPIEKKPNHMNLFACANFDCVCVLLHTFFSVRVYAQAVSH